jgi:uncharacterized protein (DUF486 family)
LLLCSTIKIQLPHASCPGKDPGPGVWTAVALPAFCSTVFLYARHAQTTGSASEAMKTIVLLFCSNVFMTFAWYGHLKYGHSWPLWKAVLVSWLIALLEYCLAVPANRLGFGAFTGFQLKIIQEAITVAVFIIFAITFLKEKMAWNYAVSFALLIAAVVVAFAFKPGTGIP